MVKDNPRKAKLILFELCQKWEEYFTQNSDDESKLNNETETTDQESRKHLEENIVYPLQEDINSKIDETHF